MFNDIISVKSIFKSFLNIKTSFWYRFSIWRARYGEETIQLFVHLVNDVLNQLFFRKRNNKDESWCILYSKKVPVEMKGSFVRSSQRLRKFPQFVKTSFKNSSQSFTTLHGSRFFYFRTEVVFMRHLYKKLGKGCTYICMLSLMGSDLRFFSAIPFFFESKGDGRTHHHPFNKTQDEMGIINF